MKGNPVIVAGLGNPGKDYADTRHNLGWRVVQTLADRYRIPFKEEKKFNALVAKGIIEGKQVYLVLPLTYMNQSGQAIGSLLNFLKQGSENLIVAVDDIALPFRQMRVRAGGSAGGHNGLKSINKHLGTQEYLRLRLGIDRKEHERELSDYVLDRFNAEERQQLAYYEAKGADALELMLKLELQDAMNQINPKLEKKNEQKAEEKPL